ncbi:hypothetical protein PUN28_017974 [Cardiocondyla obscurior]|uniref:Uncharacterized protein n=1 Tax=Cardiocondyla obscurior TaxID=286306 RepID=A0AAW2EKN6_9HYME
MTDPDVLEIFGNLDDLSDSSSETQAIPVVDTGPPRKNRVPRVGSSVQRGDATQKRHVKRLQEPPPLRPSQGRRPVTHKAGSTRQHSHQAVNTATTRLDERIEKGWRRPPPRPREASPARPRTATRSRDPRNQWQTTPVTEPSPRYDPPRPAPQQWQQRPTTYGQASPTWNQAGPSRVPTHQDQGYHTPPAPTRIPTQTVHPVTSCGAILQDDRASQDSPFTRIKLPSDEIVEVPVSAIWKNRKFRARTEGGRWLLRFEPDGSLRTCRKMSEDAP